MNTQSELIINAASARFGTVDYTRWQALRWQWYSFINYPLAGQSEFVFFGSALGASGVTLADTNLPKAGSFGQTQFLLKSISTAVRLPSSDLSIWNAANIAANGSDTLTLASDFINGFATAGVLNLTVGARPFATIPKPFMYAPPPGSEPNMETAYINEPSAAPLVVASTVDTMPAVTQIRSRRNLYISYPPLLIEAEQQFGCSITFPSGLVPLIGQCMAAGSVPVGVNTSKLKIGVILDGTLLRPMT